MSSIHICEDKRIKLSRKDFHFTNIFDNVPQKLIIFKIIDLKSAQTCIAIFCYLLVFEPVGIYY